MMDVDGSSETNPTDGPNIDEISPDFPPEASRMCLYPAGMEQEKGALRYERRRFRARTTDDRGVACDWSPGGKKIAHTSHLERRGGVWLDDVYAMNAHGSGKTKLASNPASDLGPRCSPLWDEAYLRGREGR
jgi:hypothetical protein